ncbi:hypothetical protein FRAHR75_720033 [Frankia sp. Hr75.2]|nr:hypothetical protein FRAHR75_720033 [Frankia sp. Hr75.2]
MPAATPNSTARAVGDRPRETTVSTPATSAIAPMVRSSRGRSTPAAVGRSPRDDSSAASPAQIPAAPHQAAPDIRRPVPTRPSGSANSSWQTISGCTSATDPRCSAAACTQNPPMFAVQPSTHSLSWTSSASSPTPGTACALSARFAKLLRPAARCCRAADEANRKDASRLTGTTAGMVTQPGWLPDRQDHVIGIVTEQDQTARDGHRTAAATPLTSAHARIHLSRPTAARPPGAPNTTRRRRQPHPPRWDHSHRHPRPRPRRFTWDEGVCW